MLKFLTLCMALLGLAACGGPTVKPTPAATSLPGVTPTPTIEPTPTEAIITLGVWMPESLAPARADDGARVLTAQLAEFEARHADMRVRVVAKKDSGPGGLLDLLRAAGPVAPAALPDVILLSDADLAIAAREGLIQPLDDLLNPDSELDVFTFARAAARIDGKRMGLPHVVDFNHLVYRPDRFAAPPADWTTILSDSLDFPFALADGAHVGDEALSNYQQLGGSIIDTEGQPALTLDALTRLLSLYRDAREAGALSASNLDWPDPAAAWEAFRTSGAPMTMVGASRFLSARAQGIDLDYARAPSVDGSAAPPIGRSWNFAIVTRDPRRQALAAEWIAFLSRDENAADWTQAARVLPARAAALAMWDQRGGYAAFARSELSRAVPPPSPAALDSVSPAFLGAIRDVLADRATPQAAAAAAVEAVRRGER